MKLRLTKKIKTAIEQKQTIKLYQKFNEYVELKFVQYEGWNVGHYKESEYTWDDNGDLKWRYRLVGVAKNIDGIKQLLENKVNMTVKTCEIEK